MIPITITRICPTNSQAQNLMRLIVYQLMLHCAKLTVKRDMMQTLSQLKVGSRKLAMSNRPKIVETLAILGGEHDTDNKRSMNQEHPTAPPGVW